MLLLFLFENMLFESFLARYPAVVLVSLSIIGLPDLLLIFFFSMSSRLEMCASLLNFININLIRELTAFHLAPC